MGHSSYGRFFFGCVCSGCEGRRIVFGRTHLCTGSVDGPKKKASGLTFSRKLSKLQLLLHSDGVTNITNSMHFVTTAIFFCQTSSRSSRKHHPKVTFLRSYVSLCLAWWVSRGRPALSIAKFYDATGGFNADDAAQFAVPGAQADAQREGPQVWRQAVPYTERMVSDLTVSYHPSGRAHL